MSETGAIPLATSPDGRYAASYRSRSAGTSESFHADDEIVYVLAGRARITVGDLAQVSVSQGEAVYLPRGSRVTWDVEASTSELAVLRAA